MRTRFLYGLGLGLIGLGLLTSLGGCHVPNPRHGIVFRGDWTLELNRVPWMAERGGDSYQQPFTSCDSCQSETNIGISEVCDDNTCVAHNCNPGLGCSVKPCLSQSLPAPQMSNASSGGGHSRFFPVPTRPAFSPRAVGPRGGGTNSIGQASIPAGQPGSRTISLSLSLPNPDEAADLPGPGLKIIPGPKVVPSPTESNPTPTPGPKVTDLR